MCFGERIEEGAHWNRKYSVQGLFIGFSPTFEVSNNNSKETTEHTMSEKKNTPRKKTHENWIDGLFLQLARFKCSLVVESC